MWLVVAFMLAGLVFSFGRQVCGWIAALTAAAVVGAALGGSVELAAAATVTGLIVLVGTLRLWSITRDFERHDR